MLILTQSDFITKQNTGNYFWISDLFDSYIPRRILATFFQDSPENVDMILKIISKVLKNEGISIEEYNFLKITILNFRFYRFYKSQIIYKEGVAWILTDASVPYTTQAIQSILDTIVSKESQLFKKIQDSRIQHIMHQKTVGEEVWIDGSSYIYLIHNDKDRIYHIEKKSHNCMLLREIWKSMKREIYHMTQSFIESNIDYKSITLSPFWDFFIGDKYIIHAVSWTRLYTWNHSEIIEGRRWLSAIINNSWEKAVIFSTSWKIVYNFNQAQSWHLLSSTRTSRKRESEKFVQKVKYNKDTGCLEIYYAKYSLFRESDFSDDWQKQDFKSLRRSYQRELIGVTYSIIPCWNPEEIQLYTIIPCFNTSFLYNSSIFYGTIILCIKNLFSCYLYFPF